jgi:23S rRNA (cytidine1920-2'-O)/16S rRNA (cytidine1409-2'-O)-methyltransferase
VKPQFEVGKGKVGKGGIVRDATLRKDALDAILSFARDAGLEVVGSIESSIKGSAGNIEYLALMRKQPA